MSYLEAVDKYKRDLVVLTAFAAAVWWGVRKERSGSFGMLRVDKHVRGPRRFDVQKLKLRRIYLKGDYTPQGRYYGGGDDRVYEVFSDDGDVDFGVRAKDLKAARASVREMYPNAKVQ